MVTTMSHKTLVIVESPAKAKTIEKYLGEGYTVRASVGHVRDLPKNNKDAVDIEGGFIPHYIQSSGKEKVISELRAQAKKVDCVLLATDPDREGEAIAWHLAEIIKDIKTPYQRVTFHEITKDAVTQAIAHPRAIDEHLKEAQEARRVLDRLVGYDLSGLLWKKVRYGLSAGRVQSPALRIIMEREREIRAFIPEQFFVLTAETKTTSSISLHTTCVVEPKTQAEVDHIIAEGDKNPWYIRDIESHTQKRSPRPPFTTSTLQQVASTRLGFAPSRTMGAAQKLYEAGHITYMRTDSTNLSAVAQKAILASINTEYGAQYASPRIFKTKSKSAQEAHEAIRPTNVSSRTCGSTDDQRKLYELIWERAVASQMSDATIHRTKIYTRAQGAAESFPDFVTTGSYVIFDGWLRVDTRARGEDNELPKLTAGDTLTLTSLSAEAKETQPPHRYTEAGLIKELEKRGIGRPSTYASIMKTIIDRGYVTKEGKTLIPTDTGDLVSSFLEEHFHTYISDNFTSSMEDTLDDIARGESKYTETLRAFYGPFKHAVDEKESIEKITNLGPADPKYICPQCSASMVIKLGRGGKFLSCSRFPECTGARAVDGTDMHTDEPLGIHPETGEEIYLLTGRFGPYVQIGKTPEKVKGKKTITPKRASIPKGKDPSDVTLEDAVHYLILPRTLGIHPETQEPVIANIGRFGPYIGHNGDFRSIKLPDTPYTISFERACEMLKEPKKTRAGETLVKDLGLHPKTKKKIAVYESKSGRYLKRGFARIWLPDNTPLETFSIEDAVALLTKK